MRLILTCFLLLLNLISHGQLYNLDQFYNADSEPEVLNSTSGERIDKMYRNYSKIYGLNASDSARYRPFALKFNYYLEKLNKSGKLFFDDEISLYLNQLKDFLLQDDPFRDFIHVYMVNFPQINAFTNDFGNIYVNVGTVAKLENEEQLLMVLSHEISHILLRHSLKTDVHIDSLKNNLSENDFEEMETHLFSQQQELQADSLGLQLLIRCGIDVSKVSALFDRLERNFDPVVPGHVDPLIFGYNDPLAVSAFKEFQGISNSKSHHYPVNENTEKSTHPSSAERKKRFSEPEEENKFPQNAPGDFSHMKSLASMLYVNTLMTQGYHVDALYHTLKLLEASPDDVFLRKAQLKLMLLITQSKYRMTLKEHIVNDHGNECTDTSYLAFRAAILSVNALDMNLLTCRVATAVRKKQKDDYTTRLENMAYLFLYRQNPHILATDTTGRLGFIPAKAAEKISGRYWDLYKFNSKNENVMLDSMTKEGYAFIESYAVNMDLLRNFIEDFDQHPEMQEILASAALEYKEIRHVFEKTLTADRYPVSTHPIIACEYYKKARFESELDLSGKIFTLIESTSSYYNAKNKRLSEINLEKTLELESLVAEGIRKNPYFAYNLSSDNHSARKTIASNYIHYCLTVWLEESFSLEDLNFSSVDEEIYNYKRENKMDYLVYNINVAARNKGVGDLYYCIYYYIYLDMKTGGIIYTAQIPSKVKPRRKQVELIQFISNSLTYKK